MATGVKKNNMREQQGPVWIDLYNITSGTSDIEFFGVGANNKTRWFGFYEGSSAITLANYANFPKNTVIFDTQAGKMYLKTAAEGTSTWVTVTGS